MSRNVVHNESFYKALGQHPDIAEIVEREAEAGIAEATRTAPKDSLEYVESLHVKKSTRPGRATYLMVADAPHALLVEAKYGTLARAAKTVGHG